MSKPLLAALVVSTAACAQSSTATYAPRGATLWDDGYRAVRVDKPHGSVELASFGIVEITPDARSPLTTLHTRFAIRNDGDVPPWTFAAQSATLAIAGQPATHPVFVNTDAATRPIALVERGELRIVDLYFPLPPAIVDEDDLDGFDVTWRVFAPIGGIETRTRFERLRDDGAPVAAAIEHRAGSGAYWWANPSYAWPTFRHKDGIITPAPPAKIALTRAPRRQRE